MKPSSMKNLVVSGATSLFLLFAFGANASPPLKVDVCHVPTDSPENTQLVRVGAKGDALETHLAHGDWEATAPICEDDIDDNDCDGFTDDPNAEHYDCVLQTGNANAICDDSICILLDAELSITLPETISGTYPGTKGTLAGSQSPFDLSGLEITPANPLNADTPLVNGADVSGKIALIASDGFLTSSRNKANNAANAGAVGAIIYNSDQDTLIKILGSDLIPTISVGKTIGEAILANQPVIGGIRNLP